MVPTLVGLLVRSGNKSVLTRVRFDIAILHWQALEEFLLDFAYSKGEGFDQSEFGSEDEKGFA